MRQQVHDQGEYAEAQGELEGEDRAAGSVLSFRASGASYERA